jgi:ornithine carbamoyltransferase
LATPVTNPLPVKIAAGGLRRDTDLTAAELQQLLALADQVKRTPARFRKALDGRYLALLFEKPSLRTRLTFELAIKQLGGDAVVSSGPVGDREPVRDVARNLDRWTNAIVARTFSQDTIEELARWSSVPVVNALSNLYHPCQAHADLLTLRERFGRLRGLKLAYIGDGNNVSNSLLLNAPRLGVDLVVAAPPGFEPRAEIVGEARELADGARVEVTNDVREAVGGAHAVYTDVWASMGQESEREWRTAAFRPFQVDEALITAAREDAVFLHCLPARRGEEVAEAVIESPQSAVFDQAENRLHVQKALLLMLLG